MGKLLEIFEHTDDLNLMCDWEECPKRLYETIWDRRGGYGSNIEQTKYIKMARNERKKDDRLTASKATFGRVSEFKYLGANLTETNDISWEVSARFRNNRLSAAINSLMRTKNLSRHATVEIYTTVRRALALNGFETWTLTLRHQQRLQYLETIILKCISKPIQGTIAAGRWRKRTTA